MQEELQELNVQYGNKDININLSYSHENTFNVDFYNHHMIPVNGFEKRKINLNNLAGPEIYKIIEECAICHLVNDAIKKGIKNKNYNLKEIIKIREHVFCGKVINNQFDLGITLEGFALYRD